MYCTGCSSFSYCVNSPEHKRHRTACCGAGVATTNVSAGFKGRIGGNEGPSHILLQKYHQKTKLYHCFWEGLRFPCRSGLPAVVSGLLPRGWKHPSRAGRGRYFLNLYEFHRYRPRLSLLSAVSGSTVSCVRRSRSSFLFEILKDERELPGRGAVIWPRWCNNQPPRLQPGIGLVLPCYVWTCWCGKVIGRSRMCEDRSPVTSPHPHTHTHTPRAISSPSFPPPSVLGGYRCWWTQLCRQSCWPLICSLQLLHLRKKPSVTRSFQRLADTTHGRPLGLFILTKVKSCSLRHLLATHYFCSFAR